MRSSDATEGYARAAFELATLAGSVDETDAGLAAAASALRGSADLRRALENPAVPAETKRGIARDLFAGAVGAEALAIVTLMAERGAAASAGDVAARFREIAEAERGIVVAEVTTAVPLDDAMRASVTERLTASLGRPVSLRESVDGSILGGIVVKVAGRVLDGSVSTQLAGVRRTLATTPKGEATR